MSKFAEIKARATQYPASTNDVVYLVGRLWQADKLAIAARAVLDSQTLSRQDEIDALAKALEAYDAADA